MKTKKTLKRLNKVVALLSNVIDKLPDSKDGLGDVLDSAKANVVRAAKMIHSQPSNGTAKRKSPATKRSEVDKRKGVSSVTGRRLSKTA